MNINLIANLTNKIKTNLNKATQELPSNIKEDHPLFHTAHTLGPVNSHSPTGNHGSISRTL